MQRQHTRTGILRMIAGTALAGAGSHILLENLECAGAQLRAVFCSIGGEGLGILPSIVLAAWQTVETVGLEPHGHLECLFQMLPSFWPLIHALAGAI
jgi:hypothetical protein